MRQPPHCARVRVHGICQCVLLKLGVYSSEIETDVGETDCCGVVFAAADGPLTFMDGEQRVIQVPQGWQW